MTPSIASTVDAVPRAGRDHLTDGGGEGVEIGEPDVAERDVAAYGFELDLEPGRVAEAAVRVRERREQVGMLAVGSSRHDLAGTGQHVHLQH